MESNNLENLKKSYIRKAGNSPLGWKERLSVRKKIQPIRIGKKKSPPTGQKGWKKAIRAVLSFIKTVFWAIENICLFAYHFVLLAGGGAAYMMFSGGNIVSSSNVSIDANGPIYAGRRTTGQINFTIRNQNSVSLEAADLIFDFPSNTFFG